MGAHLKYRLIISELNAAGITCDIIHEGEKKYKLITGNNHKTFRYRISANKNLIKLHNQEAKKLLLFRD